MIPIYLDPAAARIALVGRGVLAARRYAWLRDGGAVPDVWTDAPAAELPATYPSLPADADVARYHAIWIVGLAGSEALPLAEAARAARVLVNVEDDMALCDFHTPALVRRGRLTLAAATGGASPTVARAARERLEKAFPEVWGDAVEEIAAARTALRARRASFDELIADARKRLNEHGLV